MHIELVVSDQAEAKSSIVDDTGCVVADVGCTKCGYNLRGMLIEGPCPGCGLSVEELIGKTFDESGRLRIEIACWKCRYNLSSLALDGRCPECGASVSESVRGNLLRFAPQNRNEKLSSGAGAVFLAGILPAAAAPLWLSGWWLVGIWEDHALGKLGELLGVVGAATLIAVPPVALVGILLITAREPRAGARPEGLSARRVCRWSTLALAILSLIALTFTPMTGWRLPPVIGRVGLLGLLGLLLLGLGVVPFTLMRHLAGLLRRVPAKENADVAWAVALGVIFMDCCLIPSAAAGLSRSRRAFSMLMGSECAAALVGALMYLAMLLLLSVARKHFRRAGKQAASRAGSDG